MVFINPEQGQLLYEKTSEVITRPGLTERERIPKYRAILEELFRQLTAGEKRLFTDFFARISYIQHEHTPDRQILDGVHHVRQWGNKMVHQVDATATAADDARCLYLVCQAIAYFSQTDIPDLLRKSWEAYQDSFEAVLNKPRAHVPRQAFRAVVQDIHRRDQAPRKSCSLVCDTDELGTITIHFWDNRQDDGYGSDLSGVADFVWPYCTLFLTEIQALPDRPGEYKATDNSLVVLEPDYLLEAKELAECRQYTGWNPFLHLLNRFNTQEVTEAMLAGSISGQMLDEIVTNPAYDYTAAFTKVMRDNSFGMLCVASKEGRYNRLAMEKLFTDTKTLEPAIRHTVDQYRDRKLSVEPTFYSARYGLQGRIDLLLEDPADPLKKDIVEMKSGRSPLRDLYPNHEAQALVYALLLESTFPGRRGQSAILYAKAAIAETPLRAVREERPLLFQELLLARNAIVANEFRLAAGDMAPLAALRDGACAVPKFTEEHLKNFQTNYSGLDPLRKAWFEGYVRFIFRELQTAKIGNPESPDDYGGFSALWRSDAREKLDNFSVFTQLKVRSVSPEFHIELDIPADDLFMPGISNFREGDSAILYPTPDPEVLDPLHHQILKCTITRLGKDRLTVSLANKQLDKHHFSQFRHWALERDFRESGYRTMLQLCFAFLGAPADKQERILGLRKPEFDTPSQLNNSSTPHPLNPNQQALVEKALSARDYFLIQGPPGTGKTSTVLMAIVRQLATEQRNTMIIAFTNQAVGVICEKLRALGLDYIRLGRIGEDPDSWSALSARLKLDELHARVSATRIFVSTQASFAGSLDLLHFKQFDTLLIDEASQLLEPQLAGILPRFRRFIMIGDDNQLPAVVQQSEEASACDSDVLQAIGLRNFRESLFTRLLANAQARGWDDCYGMLEYHYRMHAGIADFPNRQFYGGRLRTALPKQEAPIAWPPSAHPLHEHFTRRVSYIPTRRDPRSKINEEEAELVARLVEYVQELYGPRFDPATTVGVIAPFRAQIAKIRRRLPDALQSVTIDTVERFQGSERDVIIVSFAVKHPLQLRAIQSINSAGVDRKLNVAMTRAREHLVLLGCREVLGEIFEIISKNHAQLIEFSHPNLC